MRRSCYLVTVFLILSAFLSGCVVGPGRRGYGGHPGKHKGWYKNGKW